MTIVDRNIQKQQPHKNDSCEAVALCVIFVQVYSIIQCTLTNTNICYQDFLTIGFLYSIGAVIDGHFQKVPLGVKILP